MPRISILPSAVADQIAAGEVVERPASVVKELVENALDAGATSVDVAIDEGGRSRIRVSDDGSGMDRDDALLALSRHATSKITRASDLVGIHSFGFRGEALPAICSVSHLQIDTAPGDGAGTRIDASGGAVVSVADAARRRGTTVTVSSLFYNAPARLKFMRGARSEWRAIVDALTLVALARRDVRLTVTHDGAPALTLPPASSWRARVAALWGTAAAERLLDVDDVAGPIRVEGLAERPQDVGTGTRRIFLAVNGRAIRDPGLVRAAEAAYRSTIGAGLRPTLLLALTLPGGDVDVNVHPAKAEVRFRDRWMVERAVEGAVRRALGTLDAAAAIGARRWWSAPGEPPVPEGTVGIEALYQPAAAGDGPLFDPDHDLPAESPAAVPIGVVASPAEAEPIAVPPLTQWRRTYISFEHEQGLVLIDQHSAHERVLFERFMGVLERGEAPAQRLLFPITLHLGPAESEAFDANRESFERLGFEVEGFGGHTLIVRAVPMPHPRFDPERCLRDTLDALTGDRVASTAARHEKLAATVACKAAIKAGDALSLDEMRALFVALAGTTLPAHDVHGRATIVRVGWDELERRFGRR
ncbi:MAG TPA: DNA mismatch repair endonuclease MutL [Gemmatimonadaceae bacterium]|nr:DNA mismatch repair endonuclease MutL [Gemmatimonadaceae bacterium]